MAEINITVRPPSGPQRYQITGRDGRKYEVIGGTREEAIAAVKARTANQNPRPADTSMGTAFRIGDLEAQAAGAQGRAALGRLADDSVFGDVLRFGRENIANPVREALGFDPINQDAIESKLQSDALKKAEAAQAASKKLQEETNFKNLTTDDIDSVPSFVNFVTQKLAQSGPQMLAAIGSGGYVTYPFMVGELTEAQKNLEGLTQEQKDRTAALGGLVMTALENLGIAKLLPKGTSTSIIGGIANGSISEGTTEGLQELIKIGVEYNAGKKFAEGEVLNRLKEAAAAGASSGGTIKGGVNTATKVSKIFTSDGKVNQPGDLDSDSAKAAGDFARRLRTIADANGYDLKDVGAGSTKGARETVDKAHIQMSEELKKLFRDLGGSVKPNDLETYIETADKILAQAAYREARNKTKSTVGQQEIDAMRRLVGNTAEGQQAINLMLQLNQLTEVHNEGYKGGLSRFTDVFNPFDQNINSYDGASRVVTGTLAPAATLAGIYTTGGSSVLPQAGIYGSGRALDKLTGRRSRLDRYVRRNERNEGFSDPTGPSVVEAERIRKQQEQDEALRAQAEKEAQAAAKQAEKEAKAAEKLQKEIEKAERAAAQEAQRQEREAEKRALNLDLTKKNAPPTPDSPQFTMEDATGLNRDGVARILRVLKGSNKSKALNRAITDYEQSVATGGIVEDKMLSPLIRAVRQFQEENPDYVPQVRTPNALSNLQPTSAPDQPGQAPNVDTQVYGPRYTTVENYNRGIQNNLDANRSALEGVIGDPDLSEVQKAQIATSLDVLATNLGADPVAAAEAQIVKLQEAGVPQDAIDAYVQPYVDRVIGQQASKAPPPRMAMPLEQDRLSMDYKDVTQRIPELQEGQRKLQANEITKEDYEKLVNKYKPVMPYTTTPEPETADDATYALSNGKGQSEAKAAKYGLPSKELKEGERVQLRLDIPSYSQHGTWVVSVHRSNSSPDSTAESRFKAGPVVGYESVGRIKNADLGMLQGPAQKIASGSAKGTIATMLGDYVPMTPQEASRYVEEVLPRTLEPGSGYAQVGMDPERHSYFYDRNTMEPIVSASDIVQIGPLVVAKDPVYGPKSDFRFSLPREEGTQQTPRGETTNILLPNELGRTFDFARNSNFAKGRDFKLALQEKALEAQKEEGIDLSEFSEANKNRLADYIVADGLVALQDNSNAIGWYDRTVTDALSTLATIYPEIKTNAANKLQFIWALAVTSNGTKVDKNFELAADAYDQLQRTGRFPTNIGIGEAARAINGGLQMYHTMLDKFDGDHARLEEFMNSQVPVKQIEQEYGVDISGEGKNTLVRGASILGPKIGNGFFSNLYGNFDALTMDRWLMRTVGRYRGTLININMPMVKKKNGEIKALMKGADKETMKSLRSYLKSSGLKIGKTMSTRDVNDLAVYIAKQSSKPAWRKGLNGISEDLRKAGNALAKYLDGQVEAPSGATERNFIRDVFNEALNRLNTEPVVTRSSNRGLTMSDLQALLWYPEKRLYDTAKAPEGQESRGYADDEAPDYANAARKLVEARSGMAGGNRLGSPGADGDGGRGAADPNAGLPAPRPALAPLPDVPKRYRVADAVRPPQRAPIPSTQEVKSAAKPVQATIEIGKRDGEFEDGIKNISQVRKLAEAIGVTLKMYDDSSKMQSESGVVGQYRGMYDPNIITAYALSPSPRTFDNPEISEFQSYIIALHEVSHAVNDMSNDRFDAPYGIYGPENALTGNLDRFRRDSFDGEIAKILLMSASSDATQKAALKEIKLLQDRGKLTGGYDVRYVGGAQRSERARREEPGQSGRYYRYIRGASEFAVDPMIFYLHDPKRMRREYPATAKVIQDFFKNSKKITFYSHPLAMAFAVMLASILKAEEEEKQKRMMPPGVLNQPMQAGALSA